MDYHGADILLSNVKRIKEGCRGEIFLLGTAEFLFALDSEFVQSSVFGVWNLFRISDLVPGLCL
jgi:hypothetical protein